MRPDPLAAGGLQHPIVVFSVGTGGVPTVYGLLLDRLASHGVVVIAGKGHERTIETAAGAQPWDEAAVARAALRSLAG